MLLKLGLNRHISHSVVYGSTNFLGLGLQSLHVEQGIAHIFIIMRHLRPQSEIGNLTIIALNQWYLILGLSTPLLEFTKPSIQYTGHHWFTSIRELLHNLQGKLIIPNIWKAIPSLLRVHDKAIMDKVSISDFTPREQKNFNQVYHWIRAHSIAEITTADGSKITTEAWRGNQQYHTATLWPIQSKPGQQSFWDWQTILSSTLLKHKSQKKYTIK